MGEKTEIMNSSEKENIENKDIISEVTTKKQTSKINKLKQKANIWLKDNYNLAFLGILFFAIAFRFYYFWLTKEQPLWWDEGEYMSAAKSFAGIGHYQLEGIRLPFFPMFLSIFFILGITNEPFIRLLALFLPSIILIFLTYLLIAKMYNKKIALISTTIFVVLWEHIFYSNRFHTENLALIFQFLAIFLTFSLLEKGKDYNFKKKLFYTLPILTLSIISIFFRPGNLIFFPALLVFLFLYFIFSLNIKESKKDWIIILTFLGGLVATYLLIPSLSKIPMLANYYHPDWPIGWNSLTVFNGFYLTNYFPAGILFLTFILGLIIPILTLLLSYGYIKKLFSEKKEFASDIFNLLLIVSVLFSMVFILRASSFEYRWFFPLLPAMLAFTSKGIVITSDFFANTFKLNNLAIVLIILVLILGCYPQIKHSNNLINAKLDSYQQVKDSGLWMKENSNPGDIIISASITQHSYYSERKVYTLNSFQTEEDFELFINEKSPKYFVISVFEPHNEWAYDWPEKNEDRLEFVKSYAMNTQQGQQTVLVIYEIIY